MVRLRLACLVLVLTATAVWPQDRFGPRNFSPPDIFDTRPVALDPSHFRMVLENDHVKVIRVRLGPREKSMVMEIPAHVMTCVSDQHVRLHYAHAKLADRSQKTGYTAWVERDEYGIENLEDKPVEWIVVIPNTARPE